jgi:hypothetical protein
MVSGWVCPQCSRSFTRTNQRHHCGTGDRNSVLRNRPDSLVAVYELVERHARSLGEIEVVARERYVLLRSVRIFADLVIMSDAIRIAVHLGRRVEEPLFFKVVSDNYKVTHVAKLRTRADFEIVRPYLSEAYRISLER